MENKRNIVRCRLRDLLLLFRKELTICPHLYKVQSYTYPVLLVHFGRFKHLRPGFEIFLPEANFLISEHIKCCFFNHLSGLTILDLKLSLLLIYYMPLFFNCNQNTICAKICYMRLLLWISTISIKHHLKSISHFGHKDKLNKQLHISFHAFFPLAFMVF